MTETNNEIGYTPVFRILPDKIALCKSELDRLIDQLWVDAIHIEGSMLIPTSIFREDGTTWADAEDVKTNTERWMMDWWGHRRKTEVFYILIPLRGIAGLNEAVRFAEEFQYEAFSVDGELGFRDNVYTLKPRAGYFDIHMLVNRSNGDDLLTFHKKAKYNFESARNLLGQVAQGIGLELAALGEMTGGFTMGFRNAIAKGIDYRDFDQVNRLPRGIEMKAIAGVWGDNQNLRCLFEMADGRKVRREVYSQSCYELGEVGMDGKSFYEGQRVYIRG